LYPRHGCLLLSLSLLPFRAAAADEPAADEAPRTAPPPLVSRVEPGEFIGEEQLRRVYITVGASQYGTIVPHGLRVDTANPDKVTLADPGLGFFLTLRVTPPAASTRLDEVSRQRLLQNYPNAEILDQATTEVTGHRCPSFDLRWKSGDGPVRMVRVVYLSTASGLLEFTLVADQSRFGEAQIALGGLLHRFRTNEGGALQMEVFRTPDHS
jgi:hypothetical protein